MSNELDTHLAAYEGQNLYDFDNEILLKWYPQRIISKVSEDLSLLELGLGHGFTTNIFSSYFKKHLVLDGSAAVIDHFRKRFPDCSASIQEVYFEEFDTEQKFDLIIMGFILEHVENPVSIMKQYKKYLNSGGRMFIAVPNAEVLNRRLGVIGGVLDDIETLAENDLLLGHKRYYTVNSLIHDIELAGYKIKSMEGIYLKPFTTKQILSLDLERKYIDALCTIAIDYPELSCGILAEIY